MILYSVGVVIIYLIMRLQQSVLQNDDINEINSELDNVSSGNSISAITDDNDSDLVVNDMPVLTLPQREVKLSDRYVVLMLKVCQICKCEI